MWRFEPPRQIRLPGGLSSRLLLLTAAFAVAAAVMILIPSVAAFHERWLVERARAAELASLAVEAAPDNMVTDSLAGQLLEGAGVATVAVGDGGVRRLLLRDPDLTGTPDFVDLRRPRSASWLFDPWRTLFGSPDRMIRVTARPRFRSGEFVEIVVPAAPLQRELAGYMLRILVIAVFIAAVAGAAVFAALSAFIVRPMRRITEQIESFRADPENPALQPEPTGRRDEIGRVEEELAQMQDEVRQALRSRARLAALGEAVAKINHDLRNMLTSAQIASERLATSGDPKVAKALPRLERALDRALSLAQNVLNYGRSEEPPPARRRMLLAPVVEAAAEDAGLSFDGVRLVLEAPSTFQIQADPDQLHRILVNLMRNARQAIEGEAERRGRGIVRVTAGRQKGDTVLRVIDDGPGVSERVRERLFQPFASAARPGGTGLGLAISRELAQAHGGDLTLVDSGPQGSTFEIRFPAASAAAGVEALGAA